MTPPADVVLVDTSLDHPLGFSPLGLAAHETVIVVSPNGAAITEAYALIKKVSLGYARKHFRILVNKVRARQRGAGDT
jgi:flagellar biosynthesis protein FlhG